MSKHGGCFYCGSDEEEILTSVQKLVVYPSGRQDVAGVALCSRCVNADKVDLRVKPSGVTS